MAGGLNLAGRRLCAGLGICVAGCSRGSYAGVVFGFGIGELSFENSGVHVLLPVGDGERSPLLRSRRFPAKRRIDSIAGEHWAFVDAALSERADAEQP